MNVVLFSSGYPEYMIELANALAKKNLAVTLMLPSSISAELRNCIDEQVQFKPYKLIDYKSLRDNIKMIRAIVREIKSIKPHIIHIQSNGHRWFWLAFILLGKQHYINTIHDPYLHEGDQLSKEFSLSKWMGKRFTKRYIVHGASLRYSLANSYQINKSKIDIVHHGHLGIYKKWRKKTYPPEPQHVLFFGRIWRYKGLEYLIQAANFVMKNYPELQVTIAGKGENIKPYQEMVAFPDQFEFRNYYIPEEELDELFQRCTFVVLPYREATQSGVVPIAFAYGKPVIASDVGALSEVVINEETGYLVKPGDVEELAKRIGNLLENRSLLKRMEKAALSESENMLNWNQIATATLKTYQA